MVTEGEKTEPQYINEFLRLQGAANVKVEPTGLDPRGVVEKAIQMKKEANVTGAKTSRPHVWAVFDRDEHSRFELAQQLARSNGIHIATSNPCFELWAVFHYQDHAAPLTAKECQRLLEDLCDGYRADRGKLFRDEAAIRDNYDGAVALHRNAGPRCLKAPRVLAAASSGRAPGPQVRNQVVVAAGQRPGAEAPDDQRNQA